MSALTFNLDWQVALTAQAAALGGSPKKWDNLWSSTRRHIKFWDIIGSSAAQPILTGPKGVMLGNASSFSAKMRPCWPYGNTINYQLAWGDGTLTNVSGAPQTAVSASKSWSTTGLKTVQLTARSDSFGRQLDQSTSKTVKVIDNLLVIK